MRVIATILLIVCMSCFMTQKSQAGHVYGGEIAYQAVAPGVFVGTYTGYYVPSSGIANNFIDFRLRSPGCHGGITITAPRNVSNLQFINGGTSSNCTGNPSAQIDVATYNATFTVPASQCPEWFLSVKECPRNQVDNIVSSLNTCMYVEANINVYSVALGASSPEFLPATSLVFNVNSPASYSNLAVQDNAGDSIVYALKPAMNEQNQAVSYTAGLSYSQPVPSSTGVSLHPNTGMMTFTPNVYQTSPTASNRHAVVVEAAAYRDVRGVMRKVSTTQRNLPVFIRNNAANASPGFLNVRANGQPVQPNTVVEVLAGNPLLFQFGTSDANAADSLTLDLPEPNFAGFPMGTTVSVTPGNRPTGSLAFNPPINASEQIIYFPVSVQDNSCPVRGVTTQVYGVKILGNPLGLKKEAVFDPAFIAFPNPFSDAVAFRINRENKTGSIVIHDLLGKELDRIFLKNNGTEEQIIPWKNAANYAAGVYVARLVSGNKTVQTLKFTKQ